MKKHGGKHIGFKNLTKDLESKGKSKKSAKAIAATIGRKKYGKAGMEAKAKAGRRKHRG